MRRGLLFAAACLPLMAACKLQTDCRQTGVYGLQIGVIDTFFLEPIADSTFGTAEDVGGYVDTLGLIGFYLDGRPWVLGGAPDRPGTYDIFISRPGYYDWVARDVQVVAGACGVQPTVITAPMCPVGAGACDSTYGTP